MNPRVQSRFGRRINRALSVPIGFSAISTTSCNVVCVCLHVDHISESPSSRCPQKSKPDIFTCAKFDLEALCRNASSLGHIPCACNPDQRPASEVFNWAVYISFESSVRWVFKPAPARSFMPMEMGKKPTSKRS